MNNRIRYTFPAVGATLLLALLLLALFAVAVRAALVMLVCGLAAAAWSLYSTRPPRYRPRHRH